MTWSISRPLVAIIVALGLLALPANAAADGKLERPHETASLGTFAGVPYTQYEGFFLGRTSTGNYRVPYRLSAPANPALTNRTVLVEPPHFAIGTVLRDWWLGQRFLFERRFVHASVGYSTTGPGGGAAITNRILDPEAEGVFIHGGRALPGEDGPTDDEIVLDFARALGSDKVAQSLLGIVERRYLSGVSDSGNTTDRIVAEGLAESAFDLVVSFTSDVFTDPQAAVADETYSGKLIAVQSELEWFYARDDEDRGESPDGYRHFVVPGTPHVPDGLCPGQFSDQTTPASWLPAARAHFMQGHEWVTEDAAPPLSTRLATSSGDEEIGRDSVGNALLVDSAGNPAPRLPYVELGEAAFITGFLGSYQPQPPPTIEDLGFSSHADYLAAFEDALDDQVDAGYMLDEDAQAILGRAALSPPATFTENYFARYEQFRASERCP
jgi:Alpha/beta hydrolase domain